MRRCANAVLAGLLGFGAAQAHAQTHWSCGLSDDMHRLVCVAETGPQEVDESTPATVAVVHGTTFPLDRRQLYTVELLAPAGDMEFVEQLARATMCYRTPACTVSFAGPQMQPLRVAARLAR